MATIIVGIITMIVIIMGIMMVMKKGRPRGALLDWSLAVDQAASGSLTGSTFGRGFFDSCQRS